MKASLYSSSEYLIIGLAMLIGGGSLLLFGLFLYTGSLNVIDLGMDINGVLWFDFTLSLVFFIQHSGMVRKSFHRLIKVFVPTHYHGALYAVSSGIALIVVVTFWQDSGRVIVAAEGATRILLHAIFFLSIAGLSWGARSLRSFDIVGKGHILAHMYNRQLPVMPFTIRGPYHYVRHPFYFFMLLMIWSCPDVSLDRLLFNCLWSTWIVVGTVLEERDLVSSFGMQYRNYQQQVTMLIPWHICSGK
jgi:protein-S-isoprenylcysteine O-methyltransferase Ste14